MRAFLLLLAGIVCGTGALTTPGGAASTAYLARAGSGGTCDLAAPCANMATALGVAGTSGEVICLDKGDYSLGTFIIINFAITISCGDGLWEAPSGAVTITPPAGADVVIEGLVSDSLSNVGSIVAIGGQGSVHLRRIRIGNNSTSTAFALNFQPSGPAKLFVTDSFIYNTGSGGISGAILIKPTSGVTANVTIDRTRIEKNRFGIVADGSAGGIIRGVVKDSVVAGNVNNGITVNSAGTNVVLAIDNTTVANNNFGLVASGTNAGMLVSRSFITGNATGLFTASSGGILSYRDNRLNANTTDGAFTGPVGLQ